MKKYISILACAAVLAACNKAELQAPETLVEKGGETIFTGGFAATKITLGDKEGSTYKGLWESGDELTVMSGGSSLGTATLVSGEGTNLGTFSFPGTIAEGTSVDLVYNSGDIVAEQSKASSERSFKTSASASSTIEGGSASFTLVHNAAIVKVKVASSALSGAQVNAVILRSEGAVLSADGKDYVRLALTDTPELTSSAKEFVFSVMEADCTGNEIDIAFELTKEGENYTLPIGFAGKEISANKVNSFTFSNLSDSQCVAWYEPHDTRLMAGAGYAYGEANCYFIQCKDGSTYTGGTYSANASIPNIVNIDYRARGDFRKVTAPDNVTFTWMKLGATDPLTGTGTGSVYTMRTIGYSAGGILPSSFSIGATDNYTVKISNEGAYAGAPVLLMVKEGTILWAWSFWNIAADGTSIEPVQITEKSPIKIITMDIGQATRNGSAWDANSDLLYRTAYKYQWGRPIPVFWNSVTTLDFPGGQEGNIPAVVGPLSIEESIKHPASLIVASTESGKELKDWLSTPDASLWGNNSSTLNNTGTKSIYDPCPKGYRICDRNTLINIVRSYATNWAKVSGTGYFFHTCNYPAGGSDSWSRNGCYNGTTNTSSLKTAIGGFVAAASGDKSGWWWTNMCQGDSDEKPSAYVAANADAPTFNDNWQYKSWATSVRCQVDEENR